MFGTLRELYLENHGRWSSFLEIVVLVTLYLLIGYMIDANDPLLLEKDKLFLTLFLAICTLYYGTERGIFALSLIALFYFGYYQVFGYPLMLKETLFVMVIGKFHDYWKYKNRTYRQKAAQLESKLRELGTSYYALKVSHDQLEMNYVLRPVSLRSVLSQITEDFQRSSGHYQRLMILLMKTFHITKMSVGVIDEDGKFTLRASTEGSSDTVVADPLIQEMLDARAPVYISKMPESSSRFLAAIPAVESDEVRAVVLIEDMQFMSFNEDNMTALYFFFTYFYLTLHRRRLLENFSLMKDFDPDFRFEFFRLLSLQDQYGIDSAVVVFKTDDSLSSHLLNEQVKRMHRGLDVYGSAVLGDQHITMVMTSFNIASSANVLRERIIQKLDEAYRKKIKVSTFMISERPLIEKFIGYQDANE